MIVTMGVSGCGKTRISKLLADKLEIPYFDSDDFHPKVNIDKMKKGIALTDEDRPWFYDLANNMSD